MDIDLKKFKDIFDPPTIEPFLLHKAFFEIISGFFHSFQTGVAFLYKKYDKKENVYIIKERPHKHFSYYNEAYDEYHNEVCKIYSIETNEERPECVKSNLKNSNICLEKGSEHCYKCWLGFKEYAFPIQVSNKNLAVLITGQHIPDDNAAVETIKNNINNKVTNKELCQKMLKALDTEAAKKKDYKILEHKLRKNINYLKKTIEQYANHLYEARKYSAIQEFLQESANYLAEYNPLTEEEWWSHCKNLIENFCDLTEIKNIKIFSRHGSRYIKKFSLNNTIDESIIKSKSIINIVKSKQLVFIDINNTLHKDTFKEYFKSNNKIYLYRYDTYAQNNSLSFIILLEGGYDNTVEDFVKDFCSTLCLHICIASLIFRLNTTQISYKLKVGQIAHYFRRPLQYLKSNTEILSYEVKRHNISQLMDKINKTKNTIDTAENALIYLLENLKENKCVCNFIDIIDESIESLKEKAEKHPCELIKVGNWPKIAKSYFTKRRINISIKDLIDNAIKYSWKGKYKNGIMKLHKVKMYINIIEDMVMFRITNYGIGIPEDIVKKINDKNYTGERAKIPDLKSERDGTGWGLMTAIYTFEENGGWIEIESYPADNNYRNKEDEYHRYITDVKAYLPLIK